MGVKNLWDILESCKRTLPLHHLQNKRVCVDLSCWMVQLQNVNKSHCPMKDKLYLKGLFHRLRALIGLNCSIVFVADGSIPAIKLSTYRRRLNAGDDAILDSRISHEVSSVKRNKGSEFSCMIKEAKFLGRALGIPCLDGIEEAEAQCALLNSEFLSDGCFTSDSDAFLFGARTVYRDICLGEGGYVVCYEMDDIERELGFGRNSLIALAVLLGSDYTQGVRGFGPESACRIVKSIGEPSILQRFASEGLSILASKKCSKKKGQTRAYEDNKKDFNGESRKGSECELTMDNQLLQVINAYKKPKCHSADSVSVHSRSQPTASDLCSIFDWPPEKTDEYILPKIAERDLRRFANLRSTSSNLGVRLPIDEIPVECPVSSIIKQRKLQGKNYFEVSWEDKEGLKSSTVPADLVQSACPEKIEEFQQRKARKQKPAGKPRKKADMKEIDRKLQELLLDIEKEKISTTAYLDLYDERSMHYLNSEVECSSWDSKASKGGNSISECSASASRAFEPPVIDLISPPPRLHTRVVSKCQEVRCIDVIELSDTDNDASPEHARKARELRLFISSIRD